MKEDSLLIGQIQDKIRQCSNQYMVTHTGFLDTHQQSIARGQAKSYRDDTVKNVFFGGYEDAERVIMLCLPDYGDVMESNPLTVLQVECTSGGRTLTHRDYLGSLLGLGLKRDCIGDILVRKNGADIIILEDIKNFILLNYIKAGRVELKVKEKSLTDLNVPELRKSVVKDTVASVRLDNVVSSIFGMSRSKAVSAISSGIVFVNHIEATKVDARLEEGDTIVLRGKGKAKLIEIGGKSRKDRQYITCEKYL